MKIGVVIPSYKVTKQIGEVIESLKVYPYKVYIVDDKCPENTGKFVEENFNFDFITVLYNEKNLGVGGAVKTGYKAALEDKCEIVVKLDGDGQMDANLIPKLIAPILNREADYVKGNRFFNLTTLKEMPFIRLLGNSFLTLINKVVSGYWDILDPTNGFTAIHKNALKLLELDKIDNRYFFESDMLFRLNTIKAVVTDMSMDAKYADEESNLSIRKVIFEFPLKYFVRFHKRLFYTYFLRTINIATFELIFGMLLSLFGLIFGLIKWYESNETGIVATTGTVMISVLSLILGFQLLLSFLNFDINNIPRKPLIDMSALFSKED